jgi:hypothetical protein
MNKFGCVGIVALTVTVYTGYDRPATSSDFVPVSAQSVKPLFIV